MAAAARQVSLPPRILVVEDERDICELIADWLEPEGFEILCALSDREAYLVLGRTHSFSAVLVDINLGKGTTGFDVARFARQMNADIPVIYLSGQSSEASFKAFGVPNSSFLAKPFAADDLRNRVQRAIVGQ